MKRAEKAINTPKEIAIQFGLMLLAVTLLAACIALFVAGELGSGLAFFVMSAALVIFALRRLNQLPPKNWETDK